MVSHSMSIVSMTQGPISVPSLMTVNKKAFKGQDNSVAN